MVSFDFKGGKTMRDGEEIADRERHEQARRKILLRSWSENRFFAFWQSTVWETWRNENNV